MLTYLPKNQQSTDSKQEYPWLLMLLVFVWLWPGIFLPRFMETTRATLVSSH